MPLPAGLNLYLVRETAEGEDLGGPIQAAEQAACKAELDRLELLSAPALEAERAAAELPGTTMTTEDYRARCVGYKEAEALIRAVCDARGIDHSGWSYP